MAHTHASALSAVLVPFFLVAACDTGKTQTIYFEQHFTDPGLIFENDPPNSGQVDILYARPQTGSSYQLVPGYIEFIRSGPGDETGETGGSVHLLRKTPFSPTPRSLYYQVTIDIPYSSLQARPAAYFYIGANLHYLPVPKILQPDEIVFSKFALYLNADNSYQFRDTKQQQTSGTFTGTTQVTWVLNNEAGTFSYQSPAGTTETLAAGTYDIWINTTRWIREGSRISDVGLTNISFAYYNGSGAIRLTNFLIRDVAGILPLRLTRFEAEKQGAAVYLDWEVPPGSPFTSFLIERSTDNQLFEPLGALERDPAQTQFGFTDHDPHPGMNYYRLQLTNAHGERLYSVVREVSSGPLQRHLVVAPNPTLPDRIRLTGVSRIPEEFALFTMTGRRIPLSGQVHTTGTLDLFPAYVLPAGIYLLQVNDPAFLKTVKVVVPGP